MTIPDTDFTVQGGSFIRGEGIAPGIFYPVKVYFWKCTCGQHGMHYSSDEASQTVMRHLQNCHYFPPDNPENN